MIGLVLLVHLWVAWQPLMPDSSASLALGVDHAFSPSPTNRVLHSGLLDARWMPAQVTVADDAVASDAESLSLKHPGIDLLAAPGPLAAVALLMVMMFWRRRRALAEVDDLRYRLAIDLHDDLGSDLGSIALMADLVQRSPHLTDSDRFQLGRIANLARASSEKLRQVVWLVSPQHDSVGGLIDEMRSFASSILPTVELRWDVPDEVRSIALDMPVKRDVLMVFKEALHNIARHARASAVSVCLWRARKVLHMEIGDNGVGFSPDQKASGNGLRNMMQRASMHAGQVEILSSPGAGTCVHFAVNITRTSDGIRRRTGFHYPLQWRFRAPEKSRGWLTRGRRRDGGSAGNDKRALS